MKYKYEAAKGTFVQNYFGEVGEWVRVNYIHYLWLKITGIKVRKLFKEQLSK